MNRAKFEHAGLLAINPAALGIEFLIGAPLERKNRTIGDSEIVDIRGPLEHHAGGLFDNYDSIKSRVSTALASDAKQVILAFDSPGGLVSGVYETSKQIAAMAAAAKKPLVAYVNGECCSAAYALACACERIAIPPGALLGSIGVMALAVDMTAADKASGLRFVALSSGARKLDGNPHVAATKDSEAAMQKTVDDQASVFFALVGAARGVSTEAVRGLQAGIFVGQQAVQIGLADELGTLEEIANNSATSATETTAMNYKEIRKALGEKSAGDDDEAKRCRAALAAMDAEGGEEDGKDKKDDGDEKAAAAAPAPAAKAESSESDEGKDKKDEDDKPKAAASNPVVALGAQVQSLTARLNAKEEAEERAKLMASRPDFDETVASALATQPLDVVKFAVATYPKGKAKAPNQLAAAQAAASAAPTRGDGQGEIDNALRGDYSPHDLDVQMGLATRTNAIKHEGTRMALGVMTPDQARAVLAERAKKEGK